MEEFSFKVYPCKFEILSVMKIRKIVLTPDIEKKLEVMSDELLIKTVTYYQKYNYDVSVKNKASEILKKRGVSIESAEVVNSPSKHILNYLRWIALLLFLIIGLTIYMQFYPNKILSLFRFLLIGIFLIIIYWEKLRR